jgi:hypothetical protein
MSNNPSHSSSDGDILVMLLGGALLLGSAGTVTALAWSKVLAWCLAHQVLLPAAANPLLVLPASEGAGVDLPRMAVAAAVLLAVLVASASTATRKMRSGGDPR